MRMHGLFWVAFFVMVSAPFSFVAWGEESEEPIDDIVIKAKSLKIQDEVIYTPQSITIEHPASDVYLGETLGKLPGVLVRNTSGFGSLTTVITSQALGSGGTRISIDDIPMVDPTGLGINLSLIPSTLIGGIEQRSAFYPSVDAIAETLPSPSGWINLKTLGSAKNGEKKWASSLLLGTGNTVQGTASYRGGSQNQDWITGISGFNTQGNFRFINPLNGQSENRANNDSAGVGALGKIQWHFKDSGSIEILDLFSHAERTNPGDITLPSRDHEKDTFNLLGVRYSDPHAISSRDGLFAKAAGSLSRTATRVPDVYGGSSDSRTFGQYTQAGYLRRDEYTSFTLALDNLHDFLRNDLGAFNRNVFGITATFAVDVGKFRVVPLARQEASSTFPSAGDGAVTVMYFPDTDNDLSASFGLEHVYPSITASTGYATSGSTVLPNPSLNVQRDNLASLSYNRRNPHYTFYTTGFYDLIRNRTTFTRIGPNLSQFVNTSEVSVWGFTLDGQVFPIEPL